ncbi:MAG: hypothetical protein ACLUU0_11145 [Anaerostipes hadrus]
MLCQDNSFLRSIPEGVFTVPGDPESMVDFPTIFKILEEKGYEGWLVVEAEQDPDIANPLDYAKMARAYVNKYTGL